MLTQQYYWWLIFSKESYQVPKIILLKANKVFNLRSYQK
jgi:hypothetical protein